MDQRALLYTGTKNPHFNKRIRSLAVICLGTSTRARDKVKYTSLAETEWPKSGNCMWWWHSFLRWECKHRIKKTHTHIKTLIYLMKI